MVFAPDGFCDIQNSLNEQKQLLYLSAQQQQEGLKKSLVSAEAISKATVGFFNELQHRASKVMNILEESQFEKSRNLVTFENMFKEEAAKEEKQAMDKIAGILANLTSKKTAMVSEASRNIRQSSTEENKRLQQEMTNMQQVSADAGREFNDYVEKVGNHFLETTFSGVETQTVMESCLQECTKRVDNSREQWENAQSFINDLNKRSIADIESTVETNICANHSAQEEFISISTSLQAELDSRACDMLTAVNDSLRLDHKSKKEIDTMSNVCLDQLKSTQENHSETISNIRNRTEQCLKKDYLVDQQIMPKQRVIAVPSLASIEEMRTAFGKTENNSISKKKLNYSHTESNKIQQEELSAAASPNRTPFADVN